MSRRHRCSYCMRSRGQSLVGNIEIVSRRRNDKLGRLADLLVRQPGNYLGSG